MSESSGNRLSSQDSGVASDAELWRRSAETSQVAVSRLMGRLRGRDHRIQVLERALARTVVMHHVWAVHLERKLDRAAPNAVTERSERIAARAEDAAKGIVV